jgi:hypothetical protein
VKAAADCDARTDADVGEGLIVGMHESAWHMPMASFSLELRMRLDSHTNGEVWTNTFTMQAQISNGMHVWLQSLSQCKGHATDGGRN